MRWSVSVTEVPDYGGVRVLQVVARDHESKEDLLVNVLMPEEPAARERALLRGLCELLYYATKERT